MALSKPFPTHTHVPLTDKDEEILSMIVDDLTVKEMADKLGVHEKTAQSRLTYLRNKLGVLNNVGLYIKAVEYGLAPVPVHRWGVSYHVRKKQEASKQSWAYPNNPK